ncbi:MAG: hypothetical protein U0X91_23390 [Spirosomataceae bacterium]
MRYKLDYFSTPAPPVNMRKRNRRWVSALVTSIVVLAGIILFFGIAHTAFRFREQHQNLQRRHDVLRLRYDSLYAAKLQADKELESVGKQLQLFQRKSVK